MIQNVIPHDEEIEWERRSCHQCLYLRAVISWWCTNDECIAWRGTSIPGGQGCPYWKVAPKQRKKFLGLF